MIVLSGLKDNETAKMSDKNIIETFLIDHYGLAKALEMIEEICYEKSEHLRENWQDNQSADYWEDAGKLLDKVISRIEF